MNNENNPLYWNAASYYIQEIPTCTSEDVAEGKQCPPITFEKSKAADSNSHTGSSINIKTDIPDGKVTGSTKGSRVTVRYRVKGTEDYLADPEILTGATGEPYDAEALKKQFEGYAFDSASPDFAPMHGAFANEPQVVVLEYVPITYGSLVVRHIDHDTGAPLTDDATSQHAVGEGYETQPGSFDGCELVVTPQNARGSIVEGTTTVTYEYAKKKQPDTKPTPDGGKGGEKDGGTPTGNTGQAVKKREKKPLPNTGEPAGVAIALGASGAVVALLGGALRRRG